MPKQIGSLTLYSVDDLHEKLGISKLTLRNYFKEGKLKGRKLGVSWYITEESLKDYFEGNALPEFESEAPGDATTPIEFYREQKGGHSGHTHHKGASAGRLSSTGRHSSASSSRSSSSGRKDPRRARALRYVIQGLNDLVSESEVCSTIEEAIACIKAQAIISLFEVVVIEPESGVELEKIRARDFLQKYDV